MLQCSRCEHAAVGLASGEGEHPRIHERSVVRTWGPRGTLHLLATEDLGQLLSLLGLIFIACEPLTEDGVGMDDETSARGAHAIRDILTSQGPPREMSLLSSWPVASLRVKLGHT